MSNQQVDTTTLRSATLTARDPWGNECEIIVRWLPKVIEAIDEAADKFGLSPVIWDEKCPVRLVKDTATNRLVTIADRVSSRGHDGQSTDTARRVPRAADITEGGEFAIEIIRDHAGAIPEIQDA